MKGVVAELTGCGTARIQWHQYMSNFFGYGSDQTAHGRSIFARLYDKVVNEAERGHFSFFTKYLSLLIFGEYSNFCFFIRMCFLLDMYITTQQY